MDNDVIFQEARPAASGWRNRPLIVLDAVRFTRNLTRDMLRHAGALRVKATASPKAAAWLASETTDPILLANWRGDFEDGPGLVRRLRRGDDRSAQTPAILLSDQRTMTDIEDARDAGVNSIALRPHSTQTFIDRIDDVASRPRRFIRTSRFSGPDRRAPRPCADRPDYKRSADVEDGVTTDLEAARAQAWAIIFEKLRRNDPLAARIGRSLERYLARVSRIDARSTEIIELHRAALGKLEDHRGADVTLRMDIVAGLERVVELRAGAV